MSGAKDARPPRQILFLDVASVTGWCEGTAGQKPRHGSVRFAPAGSSPEAVAAGAIKWVGQRLQVFKPNAIVIEAPLDPRHMGGKTTMNTASLLIGLPVAIGGVAYLSGVYDVRHARADDVRMFFLGFRPKKATAKHDVVSKCEALGYAPQDDNAADAIAGWHFACSIIDPAHAPDITPLFGKRPIPKREGF